VRKGFLLLFSMVLFSGDVLFSSSVITPERCIEYFRSTGRYYDLEATIPETVVFCHGPSDGYCMQNFAPFEEKSPIKNIYILKGTKIGIMGRAGTGVGGISLANQMEKFIGLGTKRFILVGNVGALSREFPVGTTFVCEKALKKDDGLSQLYAPSADPFVEASQFMLKSWNCFTKNAQRPVATWTFPSLFFQTPERIREARKMGASVVEMEAATLYAAARARGVDALALFVVSDQVTEEGWTPNFLHSDVEGAYPQLCEHIKEFCKLMAFKSK